MKCSDIEVCIRNKRYVEAANLMVEESPQEMIDSKGLDSTRLT